MDKDLEPILQRIEDSSKHIINKITVLKKEENPSISVQKFIMNLIMDHIEDLQKEVYNTFVYFQHRH